MSLLAYGFLVLGPAALKGPFDSSGFPVGCKSACLVDSNKGKCLYSIPLQFLIVVFLPYFV